MRTGRLFACVRIGLRPPMAVKSYPSDSVKRFTPNACETLSPVFAPAGSVIGGVVQCKNMNALAYHAGWYQVQDSDRIGWISEDFVIESGMRA